MWSFKVGFHSIFRQSGLNFNFGHMLTGTRLAFNKIYFCGASWSSGLICHPTGPRVGSLNLGPSSFFAVVTATMLRWRPENDSTTRRGLVHHAIMWRLSEGGSGEGRWKNQQAKEEQSIRRRKTIRIIL